ncbi:hypothetical protein PFFCH_01328 [Plasmodium falciparum FCH/4]|uniref:Uncharacterized protein n=1 Tax=Plasmodium falciparum FCH/4 TaxID=1036724 RepID=A0A024VTM6_PLAFA|nr:hypothetical protein PFFCH_01328 [Plasmodium falciparum FCH/4]
MYSRTINKKTKTGPHVGHRRGGTQVDGVKDLFDKIGRTIQQEVHKAAKTYTSELHGDLSKATYKNDKNPEGTTPADPCLLDHSLHTNVTIGGDKEYPCEKRSNVRFSDKEGAECNKSKIKDSKTNCGACAPYRRLHLCDRNLENINDYSKINNKDNLLLEVCLAAKYEGDSIIGEYPNFQNKYGDSGFTTCTMLARSFADIGDIVRGKDLYLGDNRKDREQKQKLQENLNKIFNDIKKNNQSKLGRLSLDQIREYWWEENREKIWKAITCNAWGNTYFRGTCSNDTTSAKNNCQSGIKATSNKEASIQSVEFGKITTASTSYYTAIVASVIVIIFIVLVIVVIYLILRYRRKKKMKKKLQYIKLLK